jgi:hypothetical protein
VQLKRNDDTAPSYRSSSYDTDDRKSKLRHDLLSTISLEPNILKVLDVAGSWWVPWRNLWPPLSDGDERLSLADFVHFSLAQDSLINVAAGLISIAICLQQMRPGADDYDIPFSAPPNELANNLLTAVDQFALADDDNIASLDGLEALVLRAKSYVNANNQPRKSWLLIRRAISLAQLIDLPKAKADGESADTLRRQRFMGALFETDRFMSLLMGLPYAVDDNFNEKLASRTLHSPNNNTTKMRALRRIVALVAGKVNDRNAKSPEGNESASIAIQQTLDDAASTLPFEWWNVESHTDPSLDSQLSHEHLLTQLWFFQVQSFLHLPFMLKPASDIRYERSRLVCLSSSRKLLQVYHALRQPYLAPYSSKCVDFQALIAAILILLGLLQKGPRTQHHSDFGNQEDIDLIDTTKRTFELSSMEQGGSIARQGVHMIDSLGSFVADGEGGDFIRTATLFVPYIGTISVQSGRDRSAADTGSERTESIVHSDNSSLSQSPPQQPVESFTSSETTNSAYPIPRQFCNLSVQSQPNLSMDPLMQTLDVPTQRSRHASAATDHMALTNQAMDIIASGSGKRGPQAPVSLPLQRSGFESHKPETHANGNADIGYVDVDIDWQRLMVGVELDQDWNVDMSTVQGVSGAF